MFYFRNNKTNSEQTIDSLDQANGMFQYVRTYCCFFNCLPRTRCWKSRLFWFCLFVKPKFKLSTTNPSGWSDAAMRRWACILDIGVLNQFWSGLFCVFRCCSHRMNDTFSRKKQSSPTNCNEKRNQQELWTMNGTHDYLTELSFGFIHYRCFCCCRCCCLQLQRIEMLWANR